ncbi:hypothetical protein [Nonomuraea recticatena]|uniref:hypothetical protein n=1 Tax=Nonomuraea recticatena TaxID=46178 RepID=UPI00361FCD58
MRVPAIWPGIQDEQVDGLGFGQAVEGACRTRGSWTEVCGSNAFCGGAYSACLDEIGRPSV